MLANKAEPVHRSRAAGAVCEGEEVSLQQQSCTVWALSAPRTQHCSSLALTAFGKLPRYQRKATAGSDTASRLCVSAPQLQPYLYLQNSFPLARPQLSAGFQTVLKQCGFQLLMTSTYATLLHKLEAEIIFALIMPLRCSAEAVMTETGHVLAGLNWNKNYFLDHGRAADIVPLVPLCFSTALGKRKWERKKDSVN